MVITVKTLTPALRAFRCIRRQVRCASGETLTCSTSRNEVSTHELSCKRNGCRVSMTSRDSSMTIS